MPAYNHLTVFSSGVLIPDEISKYRRKPYHHTFSLVTAAIGRNAKYKFINC